MESKKYYLPNKNNVFKLSADNDKKIQYKGKFNKNNDYNKPVNNNYNMSNNEYRSGINDHKPAIKQTNTTFIKTENISNTIKQIIIKYIYDKIDLKEYKFLQISDSSNILDLKNSKYYISPNYGGIPSLLIFLKYDDEYHSYLVDRRSLSFKGIGNENNANFMLNTVRMTKINISVDIKFYDGTIFDCCLIDNIYNDQLQIIINDIFYFCNKSLLTVNYKKKIFIIKIFFDYNYKNEKNDNALLHISPTYELNNIQELFTYYIKNNLTFLNIKGITFYPKISAIKLIYIFDRSDNEYKEEIINNKIIIGLEKNNIKNESDENIINSVKNENEDSVLKFELTDITNAKDIILKFEMKKTKKSDIYKLYSIFNIHDKYYKKKIGIAYIPSYHHTLNCKKFFDNIDNIDTEIVECIFHPYSGLWIPLNISNIKKIDIINKDSRIKITDTIIKNNFNDDNN